MIDLPDSEYEERVERARLAREEARATITEQTSTLSDIDEKAIQIFRINTVIASILVTGVSIVVSSDSATYTDLISGYTTASALFLFTSILLAAITYTATAERIGINAATIGESILNQQYDYDLVEEQIALEYGKMIQKNYEKNASNVLLFTLTLITTVGAVCYLAIGLVDIYSTSGVSPALNVVIFLFFAVFGKLSGLYGTTARWWKLTDPDERLQTWIADWIEKLPVGSVPKVLE
ncbi:hypothetical protein [Halorhabdus rudnickae]|uniref:hypothetical protein n=1 Tax=Halorhabdus rudnickae TaxID=1775544 RepID=UPI001082C84D|nr:hypothetical protein [Halorhabdus rudnickae]